MGTDNKIPQTAIVGEYDRLQATEQLSLRARAKRMGIPYSRLYRALKAHEDVTANGGPSTALQRVEIVGEAVSPQDSADLKAQVDALAAEVADLKAHRLEVDAWIATLQAQSQDTAQTNAVLRNSELRSVALPSAEPAQTWDDPDDAKAVPFNGSLPRGLKRLLDAEAKRTGLPARRVVQCLLTDALMRRGEHHE